MSDTTIRMDPDEVPTPAAQIDHGRFVPGALVGSRYRIVAMLGKGGMGEVYRADDLLLGQPVALKFLPQRVAGDPQRLARLLAEVRIARQISHPNVCRVYDIGEAAGEHFISMEYVKGEDLGSLLQRIGRLAPDKGLQVARQICAGLAAAHDRGVLHRDLKPANVMVDERGVARITDFGLAALADSAQANVREGTPAYMAPEQLDGAAVSTRSDIYALGLLLYEIFTGRVLFEAKTLGELIELRRTTTADTLRLSNDVDPIIERVIRRCLQTDPAQRPQTVSAVAAALPGGDPLAAAIAAGETPSPALVAAAGERFGIEPRMALTLFAATIAACALALFCKSRVDLAPRAGLSEPPEAMASRAREMLARLGYTARPGDRAWAYRADYAQLSAKKTGEGTPVVFRYRDSPEPLESKSFFRDDTYATWPGDISDDEPPMKTAGMTMLHLDPRGKLLRLEVVPPDDVTPAPYDWTPLLDTAGLDPRKLTPSAPRKIVRPFDQRAAWTWRTNAGSWRAEGAALGGKPVYFEVMPPWHRATEVTARTARAVIVFFLVVLVVLLAVILLARRNIRLGRGDIPAATRLGTAGAFCCFSAWLVGGHHVASFWEIVVGLEALAWAAFYAIVMALGYLAIEPAMRRRRPRALVSWTRLIAGEVRDPLVGRDLLVGAFAGCLAVAAFSGALAFSDIPNTQSRVGLPALNGSNVLLAELISIPPRAVVDVVMPLILLLLLRAIVRKDILAAILLGGIYVAGFAPLGGNFILPAAVEITLTLVVLMRFGFLATAVMDSVEALLLIAPAIWPPEQWHTGLTLIAAAVVVLIAGYGFVTSLAGRPLIAGDLIEA